MASQATKFSKTIDNPRDNKLKIPSEFMRRHGRDLGDHVSLRTPNGIVREVKLLHSNGETWLHEGWQELNEYYYIGLGMILTFMYNNDSVFDIYVFDVNGMEIEYPDDNLNIASDQVSDDSVVFVKEISIMNKKGKDAKKTVETPDHKGNNDVVEISEELLEECGEGNGNQSKKRVRRAIPKETCIAYQKAKSCKFCYPFHISIMHPSYISDQLTIPRTFANAILPEKKNKVELRGSDGKTWTVECMIHSRYARICGGWRRFVRDNALKVGDACVFEVNGLVWDVTVFRS